MTARERRALLAYARWWFGGMRRVWSNETALGWSFVANIVQGGRAEVAESLAYDGTPVRARKATAGR